MKLNRNDRKWADVAERFFFAQCQLWSIISSKPDHRLPPPIAPLRSVSPRRHCGRCSVLYKAGVSYEGVNYEPMYRWGYYAAIALVIAMFVIFQPSAKPPPPNSSAYGCYIADAAPPIRLDQLGMSILQKDFPRIGFHLERHKTAITLTADAPIQANFVNNRYLYSMYHPGEGWYLDFQRVENGRRYGEFDETQLSMFRMLARDGTEILYNRTSLDRC